LVAKLRGPTLRKEAEAREKAGHPVSKSAQGRTYEKIAKEAKVSAYKARAALSLKERALDDVARGRKRLSEVKPKRRAKPPVDKLTREYIWAKFGQWLNRLWPRKDDHRTVQKTLRDTLNRLSK
jgi:hypothetical protein